MCEYIANENTSSSSFLKENTYEILITLNFQGIDAAKIEPIRFDEMISQNRLAYQFYRI